MDEDYLRLIFLTIISTLILLLEKALFSKEQEKERDEIIKNLKKVLIRLKEY
ncbi:hypothetical protein ES702_06822 [subsurface metagenome]